MGLGLLATALVVAIVIVLVGRGGDDADGITAGHTETGRITSSDDTWSTSFEVQGGRVVVDVRGQDTDVDPVAELFDADGESVAYNDDRFDDADEWGGRSVDPLIDTELPAGTYTLEVTEFFGNTGGFEVRFPVVDGRSS